MSLFEQVAASMPKENILAYSQSRITQMRKKNYPAPQPYVEPADVELEVVLIPKFLKPLVTAIEEWDKGNALALCSLHDGQGEPLKKPYKAMSDILEEVSYKHGIEKKHIKKIDGYASRKTPITLARQEFFYRACQEKVYSMPRIGKFLGGFDHTTVLHGRIAHAKRMEQGGNK